MDGALALSLLSSVIWIVSISDGEIVKDSLSRCRGGVLTETEPDVSGTLEYSSRGRYFCRWIVQPPENQEVVVLHVKEMSVPSCRATLKLTGGNATCARKDPFCYAYISSNNSCSDADIQLQSQAMYADCNTTLVSKGMKLIQIDFTPTSRNRNKFTIEFMKATCNSTAETTTTTTTSIPNTSTTTTSISNTTAISTSTTDSGVVQNSSFTNLTTATRSSAEGTTAAATTTTSEKEEPRFNKITAPVIPGAPDGGVPVPVPTVDDAGAMPQDMTTDGMQDLDGGRPGLIAAYIVIPIGLLFIAIIVFFILPNFRKKKYKPAEAPKDDAGGDAVKYHATEDEARA